MNRTPEEILIQDEETKIKNKRRKASQRIVIRDSGVYKFERTNQEMIETSAVDAKGFYPKEFMDRRN